MERIGKRLYLVTVQDYAIETLAPAMVRPLEHELHAVKYAVRAALADRNRAPSKRYSGIPSFWLS